ncbi:alpha/beta fold hydrolase [Zafaria sp. Z1313]|uniref:alpha/beta fold hydrolase n=1 Tax=unclassified Zafaria TaxID=2828765 RepID=UPI002E781021|nr:hypothetical protein [Zafaria sp. J156]MEE1621696.1 hypothetical protein [Zafaria sp. J156]
MARIELIGRLGYARFAVQGGDIGAGVAPEVARLAPERVVGVHVNGALGAFASEAGEEELAAMSPVEQDRIRRVGKFMEREFAYISLQSTRPALVGSMLADSPVAQLAWTWTSSRPGRTPRTGRRTRSWASTSSSPTPR